MNDAHQPGLPRHEYMPSIHMEFHPYLGVIMKQSATSGALQEVQSQSRTRWYDVWNGEFNIGTFISITVNIKEGNTDFPIRSYPIFHN